MTEYTFEEYAAAEKVVEWFFKLGLSFGDTAPRIDNDWAVVIYSTEEVLDSFPWKVGEPYPTKRTFKLAAEMIEAEVGDDVRGVSWWDASWKYEDAVS
jgi:hypothetical protein